MRTVAGAREEDAEPSGNPLGPSTRLKYIAKLKYGDTLPKSRVPDEDGFHAFGSNGRFSESPIANTESPAIVVGRKGSYGKVSWSPYKCFATDTTFFVDSSACKHDLRWLYWALQTLRLDKGTDEAAVPGLNRDIAYDRRLNVPPQEEQRRIADYLDGETTRLDTLIEKLQKMTQLLEERRATMISAVVTGDVAVGDGAEGAK